ncbi:MAG TPA: hypothetical protein PKA71_03930, partial [Saprospiraceae bacterium]|nr:hypothetical protein [Saprospiraceae bacterium]
KEAKAGKYAAKPAHEAKKSESKAKKAAPNVKVNDPVDRSLKGPSGQTIYTGPRGGKYYINSNGNKTYLEGRAEK